MRSASHAFLRISRRDRRAHARGPRARVEALTPACAERLRARQAVGVLARSAARRALRGRVRVALAQDLPALVGVLEGVHAGVVQPHVGRRPVDASAEQRPAAVATLVDRRAWPLREAVGARDLGPARRHGVAAARAAALGGPRLVDNPGQARHTEPVFSHRGRSSPYPSTMPWRPKSWSPLVAAPAVSDDEVLARPCACEACEPVAHEPACNVHSEPPGACDCPAREAGFQS